MCLVDIPTATAAIALPPKYCSTLSGSRRLPYIFTKLLLLLLVVVVVVVVLLTAISEHYTGYHADKLPKIMFIFY